MAPLHDRLEPAGEIGLGRDHVSVLVEPHVAGVLLERVQRAGLELVLAEPAVVDDEVLVAVGLQAQGHGLQVLHGRLLVKVDAIAVEAVPAQRRLRGDLSALRPGGGSHLGARVEGQSHEERGGGGEPGGAGGAHLVEVSGESGALASSMSFSTAGVSEAHENGAFEFDSTGSWLNLAAELGQALPVHQRLFQLRHRALLLLHVLLGPRPGQRHPGAQLCGEVIAVGTPRLDVREFAFQRGRHRGRLPQPGDECHGDRAVVVELVGEAQRGVRAGRDTARSLRSRRC